MNSVVLWMKVSLIGFGNFKLLLKKVQEAMCIITSYSFHVCMSGRHERN